MNSILLLIPLLVFGVGIAYAEPLDNMQTKVIDQGNNSATVQLDWNYDEAAKKYKIGCVSCMPNVAEFSNKTNFIMKNVTPFPNSSIVMLYIIAYDSNDEIINAKQILDDIREQPVQ